MGAVADSISTPHEWHVNRRAGFFVLCGVVTAVITGTLLRSFVNADEMLWYDEIMTGTVAAQDWNGAVELLGSDINAPLYYLFVRVWSKLFGLSDVALRAPGLIAAAIAPVAAWIMLRGATLEQRALFTVAVSLWIPGLFYAQEARSYAFVILGAVVQTGFFYRAMRSNGSTDNLCGWALAGLFLGLTHYTTMILSAVQGLALCVFFWRTRRNWLVLAAALHLPVLLAFALHYEGFLRIVHFENFWLSPLEPRDLGRTVKFLVGDIYLSLGLAGIVALAFSLDARYVVGKGLARRGKMVAEVAGAWALRLRSPLHSALFTTAVVSAIGLVLFLGIACFRPVFMPRYLIPFAPGLFLGLVAVTTAMTGARRWASCAVAVAFLAGALNWAAHSAREVDKLLTFETESAILKEAGVSEFLVFLDQGFATPFPPAWHEQLFAFYFTRDGIDVSAREYVPDFAAFSDPRPDIVEFLAGGAGRGLIWTLGEEPKFDPLPADSIATIQRIRADGFSSVYDHTALEAIDGVTCQTEHTGSYGKYVCYSR